MVHSRETVARYAAAYRRREAERLAADEERARRMLERLPSVARMLREEFGATVVGYFGSLRSRRLTEQSDVDLYVDRIRQGGYFHAVDRAWTELGIAVDLIELEKAPPSLRDCIRRDGIAIDG